MATTARSLAEVGEVCRASGGACTAKLRPDGSFAVDAYAGEDAQRQLTVHARAMPDGTQKVAALNQLLDDAGLEDALRARCPDPATCRVAIKVNVAPASQKQYLYYSDPELVEPLVARLRERGYTNVKLVESQTNAALAFQGPDGTGPMNPDRVAERLGFQTPVTDLTADLAAGRVAEVAFRGGSVPVAATMRDSDFVISFAKGKTHDLFRMTGAFKNMYGSIPAPGKYRLYHQRKSGISMPEAATAINYSTGVDFAIVDMVKTVDGNEISYFKTDLPADFRHYEGNMLFAGRNALAVDRVVARKMGYKNPGEVIREAERFAGLTGEPIVRGTDLSPLPGFKRVSWWFRTKIWLQDRIPVSQETVSWGIRRYRFGVQDQAEGEEHAGQ